MTNDEWRNSSDFVGQGEHHLHVLGAIGLAVGEDFETAARREMVEELGIPSSLPLKCLFDSKIRNSIESENTRVFSTVYAGPFNFPKSEIDEVRFWTVCELRREMEIGSFTPNLIEELKRLFEMKII